MNRIIELSEILGTVEISNDQWELCATAEAQFEEQSNKLVITLKSFLRSTNGRTNQKPLSPEWLLKPQTLAESAKSEESHEVTRDIFHRWVQKVRAATPSLHSPSF